MSRLPVPPSVRVAMAILGFYEDVRSPVVDGDPPHVVLDGRPLAPDEATLHREAVAFLTSYFQECAVRAAVDATTLPEPSELELSLVGGLLGDDDDDDDDT